VTQSEQGHVSITGDVNYGHVTIDKGKITGTVSSRNPDKPIKIESRPAEVRLITVQDDRTDDTFDPPTQHLGKPLKEGSVLEVAKLALEYLDRIVRDGSKLAD
jgi:hypothetical protein